MGAGTNEGTDLTDNVIPQRSSGAERGKFSAEGRGTGSSWCLASQEENPQEEEGHFCWKGPCWGEGSPPEGPGHCGHLGRKIEWLSQSTTWGQSYIPGHSQSQDCCRRSWGWNRRCHQVWLEEGPAPFFQYSPPWRGPGSEEEAKLPLLDVNLEDLPELGPEVDCFLQELVGSLEEENRDKSSPEPPVEEYERWVTCRAQAHNMPDWWQELTEVPEIDDHQKLAWEVQGLLWTSTADQQMA